MLTFCKPVSSKKRFVPFRKLNDEFSFTLFDRADAVNREEWDSIANKTCIFLDLAYLKIVERCGHTKLMCRYVLVYRHNKVCGIIYYQVADFKAGSFGAILNGRLNPGRSRPKNVFEKYIDLNQNEIMMRLFTCGNNLVSGPYGFLFNKNIGGELSHRLVLEITAVVSKEDKLRGTISATLLKDFQQPLQPMDLLMEENYTDFYVEPNMVVNIPEGVKSLNDYIELFSKKYRNRAKTIFKSLEEVKIRELSHQELLKNEPQLYRLYENIFEQAKFKLNKLPTDYFSSVKSNFGEAFIVKAFCLGETIVAFGSCFVMDDCLEAHYIGFDYGMNNQYNLYQNILYMMIGEAMANNRRRVNLGRTAAEIKTTVGAKAENMICYIKPQNTISKLIQKQFISLLQPAEWTPRNPFKEESQPA